MAEQTPEMAFLQSMRNEQTAYGAEQNEVVNQAEASDDDSSVESDSEDASDVDEEEAEDGDEAEQEEDEDYDPSALVTPATTQKNETTNGTAPAVSSTKSRGKGGFIVEDSDDEDGNVGASVTNGLKGGPVLVDASRSMTGTPSNGTIQNAVQISKSEDISSQTLNSTSNVSASTLPTTGAISSTLTSSVPVSTSNKSDPARSNATMAKARNPSDIIGILGDRIAEDERGDVDAWLQLIDEYRQRNNLDEARKVYERFFQVFPSSADQWIEYVKMELDHDEFYRVENIFSRSLMTIPNLKLWCTYLDYIRRRNNLSNDADGRARQTVAQAYEFVLQNVGIDKDAGQVWKDFIAFIKSGPGTPGGPNWQDQQKMDSLRKAYRQAIAIPTEDTEVIWRDYYNFETVLNPATSRKFLQEMTPVMIPAKQATTPIQNITRNLIRSTTPKLPPLPGFDGDTEHTEQVEIWKKWIHWELEDHLDLRDSEMATYHKRVLFLYKQATMTMRFEPSFWADAADFCFKHNIDEGTTFLENGIQANPESALLAYKLADRIENTTVKDDGAEAMKRRGDQVRAPFAKLLDALYSLMKVNQVREETTISRIQDNFAQQMAQAPDEDADEEEQQMKQKAMQDIKDAQIRGVEAGSKAQNELLRKMVSFAWVALMRAMRRVQGKGKIGEGGMRSILNEARKRGQLTSDVYVASALLEHHCYKDPAARKIFERGFKLFPEDENFALEYLKHLIDINDLTNARAVFETAVNKFTQKPETKQKAFSLYLFFHHFEANYGELSQLTKLETRIRELYPNEFPDLFAHRYNITAPSVPTFDPITARPIISMKSQARPKALPSIEAHQPIFPQVQVEDSPAPFSPHPTNAHLVVQDAAPRLSPKRPYQSDSNTLDEPPRKVARGESPFKGAAGRRIHAAKANNLATPPLPRDINIFLSILPRVEECNSLPFTIPTAAMSTILRHVNFSQLQHQVQGQAQSMQRGGSAQGYQVQQQPQQHNYGYLQR